MRMTLLLILLSVLFVGCSTTATFHVLPGEDGVNDAFARGVTKEEAEASAINGAQKYCSSQNLPAEFLGYATTYAGSMDEGTRSALRATSQVAMAAGGVSAVVEPEKREVASAMVAAGAAGYASTQSRDYQTKVKFRCGPAFHGDPAKGEIRPWPYW